MYLILFVWATCVRMPKMTSDLLEVEFQAVEGCPVWVWGTEFSFSARAVCALDHWAISPAPKNYFSILVCVCVCLWVYTQVQVYTEPLGLRALWSWRYSQMWAVWWCGFWEQNLAPLQDQDQPFNCYWTISSAPADLSLIPKNNLVE